MVGGASNSVPATVANPKHAELVTALASTKSLESTVDDRLLKIVSARSGHAWSGGTSDSFFSELTTNVTNIRTATQGCVTDLVSAADSGSTQLIYGQWAFTNVLVPVQVGPDIQPPPQGAQFITSQAYKDWARGGQNLQGFLNTNVITPFRARFPALGGS